MRKNSLNKTGLSLSQAQSISNMCNQRARDIESVISSLNNAEKRLVYRGETFIETRGVKMPDDIKNLLLEKSRLHATQAFLMENIKAKDDLIESLKNESFTFDIPEPERPNVQTQLSLEKTVGEEWGWEQLTEAQLNEYYEAEAYASHIGQFIHKGGKLDVLRRELPTLKTLEWISVKDGERTPLNVIIHNKPEQLLSIHEELATLHRDYEQRVNYFKAKVKNLVTEENARIARDNANKHAEAAVSNDKLRKEYLKAFNEWTDAYKEASQKFEEQRQNKIKAAAALRIHIDSRFQPVVDIFISKLKEGAGEET